MGSQRIWHNWVTELNWTESWKGAHKCFKSIFLANMFLSIDFSFLFWQGKFIQTFDLSTSFFFFPPIVVPTPVLLPGKSHGWRSLVGCSPWNRKELDTTEWLHFRFSLSCIGEGNGNPLVFLPGESQGRGSLVGCRLWGRTESDTTEVT